MPDNDQFHYTLDGSEVSTSDPILTGRDIRTNNGLNPASDYVLIQVGDVTTRSVGLEEEIDLRESSSSVFRSFENDRTYTFTVNERGFEWGEEVISAVDIRLIAQIDGEHDLILDSKGDQLIEDDDVVRLKGKGVERIISRPSETICIVVNTVDEYVSPGRLTFEQLAKLAFPDTEVTPNTEYTVSYRKGPRSNPTGSLLAGESIKLKKGMIFDVSETDKS